MTSGFGRATRTSVFMAVFVAVLMLGLPSFGNGHSVTPGAVDQASAAAGSRTVYIGWVGMRDSVATLSPLLYTMAGEMSVIWPCYSMLTQYDLDGQTRIGDLAKSWSVAPDGLTWTWELYSTARFYDKNNPTAVHPVTADDVIFTYYLIQNQTGNYLQSYFPKIEVGGVKVPMIDYMQKINDYKFVLKTKVPYAPFLSATSSIPILPKYIWEPKLTQTGKYGGWNWPNFDPNLNIPPIVGSGAFYFMEDGLTTTGDYRLGKSPTWFATEEYGWTLRNDVLYFKSETSTTSNYNDYKAGAVDIMIGVTPAQYLSTADPLTAYGNKFAKATGFVYEFNINQINATIRDTYGIAPQLGGKDNPILNDPIFRLAVAMSVNKQGFVDDALRGLGAVADSLVPDASPAHYWYGLQSSEDPIKGRAPAGEEPVAFDPVGARMMLMANGWKYRTTGTEILSTDGDYLTYKPLCKAGGTQPLQFRFWTLNTAAEWDAGARYIANTTAIAGIDLLTLYDVKSISQMNSAWAQANYDLWLWDWMFSPASEVSTDVMQVLTSEAIGSWSDVYVSDPVYDSIYYESLQAVDPGARLLLTDKLQRIAYERFDCQAVAYRKELYAAGPATANGLSDHWTNYGNWENEWLLMPDQLAPYLYMRIQPRDQQAPQIITVPSSPVIAQKNVAKQFTASATDGQGTEFRWFWGDGSKEPTYVNQPTGSSTISHTYAQDGYYTAWVAVRENTGIDKFVNVSKILVKVEDASNFAPTYSVTAHYTPASPDQGTLVSLAATATDVNPGDTLTYWWVTNDGHTLFGQNVTYQFKDLSKTVATCYVDDGHVGTGDRPVTSQVLVNVGPNYAPTITVPPVANVGQGGAYQFNVTADDQNPADKTQWRFTWVWGDGSTTVTTSPTASHTYSLKKIYTYTVYVDDMTGLSGHNQSGTNQIQVTAIGNLPPDTPGAPTASPASLIQGGTFMFYGNVSDPNGKPATKEHLEVSFEVWNSLDVVIGYANTSVDVGNQLTPVSAPWVTDVVTEVGTHSVWMTVWDGQAAVVYSTGSATITVTQANRVPVVGILSSPDITKGIAHTFTITASDPDGDTLHYLWDFGDGNFSALAAPSKTYATIQSSLAYSVSVDDGTGIPGHNITRNGYVTVNMKPIVSFVRDVTVLGGTSGTFYVTAQDDDDLISLNYIWNWGDGSAWDTVIGVPQATHTYPVPVSAVVDYTITVYANDMFVDVDGYSHNASGAAKAHVAQEVMTLTITQGWNFITTPMLGYSYKASTLGLDRLDVIVQWNTATKVYDKTFIVGVSPIPLDITLSTSRGYWVSAGANMTLAIGGTAPTGTQTRTINVPAATTAWVDIGLASLKTTWKASNIPGMISGATVSSVAQYDPIAKTYKTYITGVPPSDYPLIPGRAVWVSLNSPTGTCTLTYTP